MEGRDWAFLAVLAAVALATGLPQIGSDFSYPDASRHAMDGVFVKDFGEEFMPTVKAVISSAASPRSKVARLAGSLLTLSKEAEPWAEDYYAHYPALAIGYYPPLFAMIEAPFFYFLGISSAVARVPVLLSAMVGFWLLYAALRQDLPPVRAFVPSLLFATSPAVVKWSRDVMLEMPAYAFCFASLFFAVRFARERRRGDAVLAAALAALGLYVKQTTAFLGVTLAAWGALALGNALASGDRGRLRQTWKCAAAGGAVYCLMAIPIAWWTLKMGGLNLEQSLGAAGQYGRLSLGNWVFYLKALPKLVGWWMLPLVGLGFFISLRRPVRGNRWALLLWLVCAYGFFSLVSQKSSRLGIFLAAPLCFYAGEGVEWIREKLRRPAFKRDVVWAVCLLGAVGLLANRPTYVYGFERAAEYALERSREWPVILYQGKYNGNFIFQVRRHDPGRRYYVMRGTKKFVSMRVMKEFGYSELAKTDDEVREILKNAAAKNFIIEDKDLLDIEVLKTLRRVLLEGGFDMYASFSLRTNVAELDGAKLLFYELPGGPRTEPGVVEMQLGPVEKTVRKAIGG